MARGRPRSARYNGGKRGRGENNEYSKNYQQTSPESHFTQKRVCSLATRSGRITLSDQRLITTIDGERTERLLTDEEYQTVLAEQFGIVLSPVAS
jgi:arylamine N-acetyltransferase